MKLNAREMALVDFVRNGKAHGEVANRLAVNGTENLRPVKDEFHTNATLAYDEWKAFDTAVIKASQPRLSGIADLQSRGLTYDITDGIANTILQWDVISDTSDADLNMDGAAKSRNEAITAQLQYLPLPIIHKGFVLNARQLAASRKYGMPLDTTNAELAAIKVAQKCEDLLFNGSGSYAYGGGTIYGYTDYPFRATGTLALGWDNPDVTGVQILDDVLAMKQALINNRKYGPYILYVPTAYETALDNDFKAFSSTTVRERIIEVGGVQDVKVADILAYGNVVLVQVTLDVVRVVNGLPLQTVEWQTEGNMIFNFKIMTIMIPNVRSEYDGKCGVAHFQAP